MNRDSSFHANTPRLNRQEQRIRPGGGFIIGVVTGFSIALSFLLLRYDFLADAVDSILVVVIIVLLVVLVLSGLVYAFRAKIFRTLLGGVSGSGQAFLDTTSTAINSWLTDRTVAARAATEALKEGVALATWLIARRTIVTIILSLMGTLIALAGTTVLLRQTTALELQNDKLDLQLKILAGQGKWEQLWNLHYAEPSTRIEAAIQLASNGYRLSGIQLIGDVRDEAAFVSLSEKLRHQNGTFDPGYPLVPAPGRLGAALNPQALFRSLPDTLARNIENARLVGVKISFPERNTDLDRFSFRRSIVTLESKERTPMVAVSRSNFDQSLVRLEQGGVRFVDTSFRQSIVQSFFDRVVFEGATFDGAVLSLVWGRDFIADARGYAVVLDYHGSGPVPSETDPPAGFGRCSLENVVFVGRQGGIPHAVSRSHSTIDKFLDDTVSCECQIGRIFFVEEQGVREQAELRIIDDATDRAAEWMASRRRRCAGNSPAPATRLHSSSPR